MQEPAPTRYADGITVDITAHIGAAEPFLPIEGESLTDLRALGDWLVMVREGQLNLWRLRDKKALFQSTYPTMDRSFHWSISDDGQRLCYGHMRRLPHVVALDETRSGWHQIKEWCEASFWVDGILYVARKSHLHIYGPEGERGTLALIRRPEPGALWGETDIASHSYESARRIFRYTLGGSELPTIECLLELDTGWAKEVQNLGAGTRLEWSRDGLWRMLNTGEGLCSIPSLLDAEGEGRLLASNAEYLVYSLSGSVEIYSQPRRTVYRLGPTNLRLADFLPGGNVLLVDDGQELVTWDLDRSL